MEIFKLKKVQEIKSTLSMFKKGGSDAIILESNRHFAMIDTGEDYDFPDGSDSRYPWREELMTSYKHVLKIAFSSFKGIGCPKLDFILVSIPHRSYWKC